ncbi:MAG: hypothetical protein AAF074_18845 [Pseudomonadota bacterium]
MVPMNEIRAWANAAFDALEAAGAEGLEPADGGYWMLDTVEAWDLSRLPEPMTGDLADDVGDIRRDLAGFAHIRGEIAWHTLDHLIGVLAALSQQNKIRLGIAEGKD